jgi:hypothetical protein
MSDIRLDFQPDKATSTKGVLIVFGDDKDGALHSDTLDIANSKKRKQFVKDVNTAYQAVSQEQLDRAILEKVAQITAEKRKADEKVETDPKVNPLGTTPQEVKEAALEMLKNEKLFEQISADIRDIGVAGEEDLALMLYVVMTSRLLDRPLSAIVQGASASGKSYIIETIGKLMPPESVVQAHDFSDQALYYLPEGSLVHRVVISGERVNEYRSKDGFAEDNTKGFREMVASRVLRKAVTITGKGKKPKTEMIEQPGPISYLESSTAANIHDEDSTRLLPLVTDESADQTKRIIEAQRREAKGQTISEGEREDIIQRHHTLQRFLRLLAVQIPYIDSISLPETNIATRRTYDHFISAIKSVALLRQYQKQNQLDRTADQECIEADEIDYRIAYELMGTVLARTYSPLNQQARDLLQIRLLQILLEKTKPKPDSAIDTYTDFTQKDAEEWAGAVSNTTVRRRLEPLEWAGIITVDKSGKPYQYRIIKPQLAEVIDLNLPAPEDIAERIAIMSV